ncbi:MAG: YbaN family protein [Leuconostoc mesenteroides]
MKILLIALGALSFAIGTIAIWIPGLPTTGFYVLTAILWSKSSKKLDSWLHNNKYYQKYVDEAVFDRQLSLKGRALIYSVTAAMMAIPFFKTDMVWLKWVLPLTSLTQIISMESYYRGYLWRDGIPFTKAKTRE